ncbi:MAG: hypothetical protein WAX80_00850 [Minisyncoccia bacterium]
METGYVKFFDTREGKLFGFVVDEMGNELFFHYSGGRAIRVREHLRDHKFFDFVHPTSPMQFPKKGDRIMFYRGENAKGAKATAWCFKSEYDDAVDKSKRTLTLDEAKELLSKSKAKVLEYVKTMKTWGSTVVIATTEITWCSEPRNPIATGKFRWVVERCGDHTAEDLLNNKSAIVKSESAVVEIFSTDRTKFHNTDFQLADANALKTLGKDREVESGVYESVMWNGGSDQFVVDPKIVRDMTPEEFEHFDSSVFPSISHDWLLCRFATQYGERNQVVKVLRHLGGGE